MDIQLNFDNNWRAIRERVAAAAARAGCAPGSIRVMAVTKTFTTEHIQAARAAGFTLFGENRVQEAVSKYGQQTGLPGVQQELHLIGHLQRNKVKPAVQLFRCIQSVDKLETALAIEQAAADIGKVIDILVEINTSGEESKSGIRNQGDYFPLLERLAQCGNLRVCGLMTIAPFTANQDKVRQAFARLRDIFDKTRAQYRLPDFEILSMGMSADFEIAIEEGANLIRLGTALFGSR